MQLIDVLLSGDFEEKMETIGWVRLNLGGIDDELLFLILFSHLLGHKPKQLPKDIDFVLNLPDDLPYVTNTLFKLAIDTNEDGMIKWYAIVALVSIAKEFEQQNSEYSFFEIAKIPIDITAKLLLQGFNFLMNIIREKWKNEEVFYLPEYEFARTTFLALGYFKNVEIVVEALIRAAERTLFVGHQNIVQPHILAIRTLGEVGGNKTVEFLRYLVSSCEGEEKKEAQEALARLGSS